MATPRLRCEDYSVGWVCALPVEFAAAREMLDEKHEDTFAQDAKATNRYTVGRIGNHNMVIVCMPSGQIGTNSAAVVAKEMMSIFPCIQLCLMVGIGGGVPSSAVDIRLGDVVVSQPYKKYGGVVQYDFGKATPSGFEQAGSLNSPPAIALNAISIVQADHIAGKSCLSAHLSKFDKIELFAVEKTGPDLLFEANYEHAGDDGCVSCAQDKLIERRSRTTAEVAVHYGTIASGNKVIKDGALRDKLSTEFGGILCFEMEAAGLMNYFPSLVIRGICDYADSHKNKRWQAYAAATASAYAKEVLLVTPNTLQKRHSTIETARDELPVVERDLLKTLYFPEMNRRQNDIADAADNTCEWLMSNLTYLGWLNARSELMWIMGNAGAGKSTLMNYATRHAGKYEGSVASFFFNGRGSPMEKNLLGLYRSLLHQLLPLVPEKLSELSRVYKERCETQGTFGTDWKWHESELKARLKDVFLSPQSRPVRVYVDALDESGEETAFQLIEFFEEIVKKRAQMEKALSICFSCRHYPIISIDGPKIFVETENSRDIENFVHQKFRYHSIGQQKAEILASAIIERASGLFQWVTLVIPGVIRQCKRGIPLERIKIDINKLPQELHDLYDRTLDEIPVEEKPKSLRLLQWICFAKRSLNLDEMLEAIIIDPDSQNTSLDVCKKADPFPDTFEDAKNMIIDLSKGLAEVQQSGKYSFTARIQLVHQSVSDYLLGGGLQRLEGISIGNTTFDCIGRGHLHLALSCIWYIGRDEIYAFQYSSTFDFLLDRHRLISYAIQSWHHHASVADEHHLLDARKICQTFHPNIERWMKLWNRRLIKLKNWVMYRKRASCKNILHICSQYGIVNSMPDFLQISNTDVNSVDECSRTPLSYASEFGHIAIVEYLLGCRDVNAQLEDEEGHPPLYFAISKGHVEIVKILLARDDSNTNSRDHLGQTLLTHTAEGGNTEIVELLLAEDDIDAASADGSGMTALNYAAQGGHKDIVKLLLARDDVDPNSKDIFGLTALLHAVRTGKQEVIELLLQQDDVSIHAKDEQGRTALSYAALCGQKEMVELILGYDNIDINQKDYNGNTPLIVAARWGREGVVELLLAQDKIDVNAKNVEGKSPLWYAAAYGNMKVVELLLSRENIDVNAKQNRTEGSPLSQAIDNGYTRVIELLLAHDGIDLDALDYEGYTPLSRAARMDSMEMIELLVAHDRIDVNAQDGWGETALSEATRMGRIEVVKLLLARDEIDVNTRNGEGDTPLSLATTIGHMALVELLLKHCPREGDLAIDLARDI